MSHAPSRNVQIYSWATYDFANTIFSMNVISMYFPLWVTGDMGGKDIYYSLALSASMVAAALTMPLIGAVSDQRRVRVPFLAALTLFSAVFTALIGLKLGLLAGLVLFALANYGYQAALTPYDTLLPEVSRGVDVGKVSGLGVGLGYLGSIGGLLMVKPFVEHGGRTAAFVPTAILFALFSLPAFFFIKEAASKKSKRPVEIRRNVRKIFLTLRNTRRYPGLARFLTANLVYSDAVNTVIAFMAVYASKVIGFTDTEIMRFMITSTVFAAVGSFVAGRVTDRLGPRKALFIALGLWSFTLALTCLSFSRTMFWAVGPLAGISLGSTWVSSRALVARLTPPRKFGEVYGLYNLGGKFGFVIGPLVWGGVVLAFEPLGLLRYRIAIFSLLVFVVWSIWILKGVPDSAEKETACRVRGNY